MPAKGLARPFPVPVHATGRGSAQLVDRRLELPLGGEPHRPVSRLRGAVAELAQRYGTSPLYQIVEVNRWARLPEHRWALATYEP